MPKYSLMVAGTRSGSGKTTLTLALLAAFARRGIRVQASKVGPDFIDPTHHSALTNRPSYNLDAWMGAIVEPIPQPLAKANAKSPKHTINHMQCPPENNGLWRVFMRMQRLAHKDNVDMLLTEGAMGLFDGAQGMGGPGSAAHLAKMLHMPILLALDVRGMGQSAAAMALGYIRAMKLPFAGVVCTHVGSENHQKILHEALSITLGHEDPPILGYIPKHGIPSLPSRHLGLYMAHEHTISHEHECALAHWIEEHVDIEQLLIRAQQHSPYTHYPQCHMPAHPQPLKGAHIGIAKDAAFCFLYPDMPEVLHELGATYTFFSPLHDTSLPANCTALFFPGGYPELHAHALSQNSSMLTAIRLFAHEQKRIYAECGGYMYLMQSLEYENKKYNLCGLLPLHSTIGKEKAALGYRKVIFPQNELMAKGHEFHYGRIQNPEILANFTPLYRVYDRNGEELAAHIALESAGIEHKALMASWIHLYPEGARQALTHIFRP